MPQAIKDWYVRNNKSAYLTPLEYNNDELSDVWDMEMLASDAVPVKITKDTIKTDTNNKKSTPTLPTALPKYNKDSALNNSKKKFVKKKPTQKPPKIKQKANNNNVNQL
jgi:hypothetical protein